MKIYICSLAASLLLTSSIALADNVAVIPLPANTSADKQLLYNDRGIATGADIYFDKTSGNVGIGTATPTQQLEVAGTVQATAFTVGGIPLMSSSSTFWSFFNDDLFTFGDVIMQRSLAVGQESSPGFDFQFDTIALMDREVSILSRNPFV